MVSIRTHFPEDHELRLVSFIIQILMLSTSTRPFGMAFGRLREGLVQVRMPGCASQGALNNGWQEKRYPGLV